MLQPLTVGKRALLGWADVAESPSDFGLGKADSSPHGRNQFCLMDEMNEGRNWPPFQSEIQIGGRG